MQDLNEIDFHYSSMSVIANKTNWREVTQKLIGDEDVEFKAQDLEKQNPIIRIWSRDKKSLDRVQTLAAEAGE